MGEASRRAAIPPLKDWLAQWKSADAAARDSFDDFATWGAKLLKCSDPADTTLARNLRVLKTMVIAINEVANHEHDLGAKTHEIIHDLTR